MQVLVTTTKNLFTQIETALSQITNEQYAYRNAVMSNATIGQHVRHIIELYQEMLNGYRTGEINYEKRQRNFLIETNIDYAIEQMNQLTATLLLPDKNLMLALCVNEADEATITTTNYVREVMYNIEHTIHHMALIRIAFATAFKINLEVTFGVAPATIKYQHACAQ
jgi:hypothetical protein